MSEWNPKVGDWFILKSSYCDECTEDNPCPTCLSMCNRFVISASHFDKDFFFGGGWCVRGSGCFMDETYSAILTKNRDIVDGVRMIHHISEAIPIDPPK